jgi:serine/threonine protein kinase
MWVGRTITNPRTGSSYHVEKLIGSGTTSDVYAAWSSRFSQRVAVKIIPADTIYQRERAAYDIIYQRERAAYELASAWPSCYPDLVCLYEAFQFQNRGILVLELLTTDLYHSCVPDPDIPTLLRSILGALGHLHQLGLSHGDISLSNIYRSGSTYKLGDLGQVCSRDPRPHLPTCASLIVSTLRNSQAFDISTKQDILQLGQIIATIALGVCPAEVSALEEPNLNLAEITDRDLRVILYHMLNLSNQWSIQELQAYLKTV